MRGSRCLTDQAAGRAFASPFSLCRADHRTADFKSRLPTSLGSASAIFFASFEDPRNVGATLPTHCRAVSTIVDDAIFRSDGWSIPMKTRNALLFFRALA